MQPPNITITSVKQVLVPMSNLFRITSHTCFLKSRSWGFAPGCLTCMYADTCVWTNSISGHCSGDHELVVCLQGNAEQQLTLEVVLFTCSLRSCKCMQSLNVSYSTKATGVHSPWAVSSPLPFMSHVHKVTPIKSRQAAWLSRHPQLQTITFTLSEINLTTKHEDDSETKSTPNNW